MYRHGPLVPSDLHVQADWTADTTVDVRAWLLREDKRVRAEPLLGHDATLLAMLAGEDPFQTPSPGTDRGEQPETQAAPPAPAPPAPAVGEDGLAPAGAAISSIIGNVNHRARQGLRDVRADDDAALIQALNTHAHAKGANGPTSPHCPIRRIRSLTRLRRCAGSGLCDHAVCVVAVDGSFSCPVDSSCATGKGSGEMLRHMRNQHGAVAVRGIIFRSCMVRETPAGVHGYVLTHHLFYPKCGGKGEPIDDAHLPVGLPRAQGFHMVTRGRKRGVDDPSDTFDSDSNVSGPSQIRGDSRTTFRGGLGGSGASSHNPASGSHPGSLDGSGSARRGRRPRGSLSGKEPASETAHFAGDPAPGRSAEPAQLIPHDRRIDLEAVQKTLDAGHRVTYSYTHTHTSMDFQPTKRP